MQHLKPFRIFIVEDDLLYSRLLQHHLAMNPDYEIKVFHTGQDCVKSLHEEPDVITLDYTLPDMIGADMLKKIKSISPHTHVVVVSGQQDVQTAIDILKQGAYDYIVKNDETKERIWNTICNIKNHVGLKQEIEKLKTEIIHKYNFSNQIIGTSVAIKKIFHLIDKAINTNITVSITGETGTGKELIAKSIHYNSGRKKHAFVAINLAALPKELIETELFGHEKGAFTGALARRIGKFEEAHGGTLFLDEVAELDLPLQSKLLRVLQEREITRIGGNNTIPVDVRIITATHKNLAEEVRKGHFREDLYYRLFGLPIYLPPLRDRNGDVLILAKYFIKKFCSDNKIKEKKLSSDAKDRLMNFSFPGNVRELKAVVELAVVMSNADTILAEDISFNSGNYTEDMLGKEMTLDEYNKLIITHFLDKYDNNIVQVARKLDIGKSTLYRMIQDGLLLQKQ